MKKMILLIDDDEDLLRSFQVNLEIFGYNVVTAPNSDEGLIILKNEKPDLVVLDVMMNTNLEGFNFLLRIKNELEYKNLPILLLTGMSDQLGVNLFSAVEDVEILPNVRFRDKPIAPLELGELIEDMLQGKRDI